MSQGSHSDSRRGMTYPYIVKPQEQTSHFLPIRPMRSMTGLEHTTTNQVAPSLWASTSLPSTSALSHPRIVPSSQSNVNYPPLVSYQQYSMDGLMLSPPLGSSNFPKAAEVDPYLVPPLSNAPSSNSSSSRPATGTSPRRDSTGRTQSPTKKRKSGEGKLPTFLVRLYELLKEPKYPDLLTWDETGQFIVAHTADPRLLEVLKSEYNQNRVASFTRQLNIYGWMRDNITRNTESTEPTLWRHDSLNRESTMDDLLTTVRRVAPRTSQAEKRRRMEEEENDSPHRMMNPWSLPTTTGGFSLGTAPLDAHRPPRNRRFSYQEYDDPRPLPDALPLHHSPPQLPLPMDMPYTPGTGGSHFFVNERPKESINPGVRWITGQESFLLQNGGSANSPRYEVDNPTSWARHGISPLGNGLKPFQPAPLDNNSPEASIQQLTSGIQAFNMPQTSMGATMPEEPAPPAYDSPQEPVILTPPPSAPQPLRQHVVPGSYMGPNMCRTASWTPRAAPPRDLPPREVMVPRSSSVLQRVMHGQSGLSFLNEDEVDPLPSSSLPHQPRLFDDFEEPKI